MLVSAQDLKKREMIQSGGLQVEIKSAKLEIDRKNLSVFIENIMQSGQKVQNVVEEIEEIEIKKVKVQKEDAEGIGLRVETKLKVGEKIEKIALEEVIKAEENAQIIDTKQEKEELKGIVHHMIKNQNAN